MKEKGEIGREHDKLQNEKGELALIYIYKLRILEINCKMSAPEYLPTPLVFQHMWDDVRKV